MFLFAFALQGQQPDFYRSPARAILNMFSVNLSTGYAYNSYRHNLAGFYFLQTADNQYIFTNTQAAPEREAIGYTGWLNDPALGEPINLQNPYEIPRNKLDQPVNNPLLANQNLLVDADTAGLGFRGSSHLIPVLLSVHFNYKMFRVGGGYQIAREIINPFEPTVLQGSVRRFDPQIGGVFQQRLFGLFGVKFYEWWNYGFAAEAQIGRTTTGSQFNREFVERNMFVNIGLSIEKSISEYVRFTFRPSYDLNSYSVTLPEAQGVVQHKHPGFMFQVGISINYPEIPRTPIKADHVQLKHLITDPKTGIRKEVRGQPIYRWQNPKIGQNHRKLKRYKGRNKRKMNPY